MRLNSSQLIKPCGTLTASSPGTESVGLRADPAFGEGRRTGVMVFANAIWTVLSWPDSYRSLTGTCKNHATL